MTGKEEALIHMCGEAEKTQIEMRNQISRKNHPDVKFDFRQLREYIEIPLHISLEENKELSNALEFKFWKLIEQKTVKDMESFAEFLKNDFF